jgi:hypothetical protein
MELSRPPFKQRIKPQFTQFHYTIQKWHISPPYSPLSRPGQSKFCGPEKKFGLQNQQEPNHWRKELDQTRMTLPLYGKFKPETVKIWNVPWRLPLGFSTSWRSVYIEILKPSTCCNSGHPAIIFGRTPVHSTHVKNIGCKKISISIQLFTQVEQAINEFQPHLEVPELSRHQQMLQEANGWM